MPESLPLRLLPLLILATFSMTCSRHVESSIPVEPLREITVTTHVMPCLDPGTQPIPPGPLGLEWDSAAEVYTVRRDPVLALAEYLTAVWAWSDRAEVCVDAQRRAAEVTP